MYSVFYKSREKTKITRRKIQEILTNSQRAFYEPGIHISDLTIIVQKYQNNWGTVGLGGFK